jgi:hypothetical protein
MTGFGLMHLYVSSARRRELEAYVLFMEKMLSWTILAMSTVINGRYFHQGLQVEFIK